MNPELTEKARKQFDRQAAAYGADHILSQTGDLTSVLPLLKPARGEHLLDIATGAGHTAIFFARLGLEVTAVDVSPAMLAQTETASRDAGVTVNTVQAPAESLPFASSRFDLATCRMAAHHFACPASFCMEAVRVLRPGGHLLLIDGTVEDGHEEAEAWAHEVESLRDPSHNRLITPLKWTHLLGHVGFRVLHQEIQPLQQPDLEWYFETADTPEENRQAVLKRIHSAPEDARRLFAVEACGLQSTWTWQQLVMVARKHKEA